MTEISALKKKLIGAVAGVVALASSYWVGFEQRPKYNELPQKVQQAIVEEHTALESLLQGATKEFQKGNLDDAVKRFRTAESLAARLSKIDPKYTQLVTTLDKYRKVIDLVADTRNIIEEIRANVEKMNAKDLAYFFRDFHDGLNPPYPGQIMRLEMAAKDERYDKNAQEIAATSHLLLLIDYKTILQSTYDKLMNAEKTSESKDVEIHKQAEYIKRDCIRSVDYEIADAEAQQRK